MKRIDLICHLERHGGEFLREGGSPSIYVNRAAKKVSARKICKDLDFPRP